MTFVDALLQRYTEYQFEDCPCEVFVVGGVSPGQSGNHLILPPALSLNGCRVKWSGPESRIRELCRSVEELDLASNELTDINEIYKITRSMPNLRFLNLSENDLSLCNANVERHNIKSIKSLVLNNTKVPWNVIHSLLDSMPCVDDLHLSLNNYRSIELNSRHPYPNVRHLYLSGNPELRRWEDIKQLVRTFPLLHSLTMADCNVSTLPNDLLKHLPHLQSLNISNWPIDSWDCLERLNELPNLIKLRCQGIYVLNDIDSPESRRYHLIARLPNVQRLNGGDISNDERVFAEKAFLRWYITNEDVARPKRYHELESVHGKVHPLAEVDLSPPKHADVKVVYNENCNEYSNDDIYYENETTQTKTLKIDLDKSVKDFKVQLGSMFGVSPSQMKVYYVDHEMTKIIGHCVPEELRYNHKKLYTYNVQDGDEILVNLK